MSTISWILLSTALFIVIAYMVVIRWIETHRVERKFSKDEIIITSYGVNYFGLSSESGKIPRSVGIIVLLKSGLYYRAKFFKKELLIPRGKIKALRIVETHKGKPLYQKAMAIDFVNSNGVLDTAAFRVPFMDQWLGAIKRYLIL